MWNFQRWITFYLCPYLEQQAYFGINFWCTFDPAPGILSNTTPESCKPVLLVTHMEHYIEDDTKPEEQSEVDSWVLSEEKDAQLEGVKKEFLSFEKAELTKSTV